MYYNNQIACIVFIIHTTIKYCDKPQHLLSKLEQTPPRVFSLKKTEHAAILGFFTSY